MPSDRHPQAPDEASVSQAYLALSHLRVAYDTPRGMVDVIHDFSLSLERGQVGCLLGPSGCGKSTVLRAIAGFEPVLAGSLCLDGRLLSSSARHVAPEDRRIGMMFQDYALFPHLTVSENVGFGVRGVSKEARRQRVQDMLDAVRLPDVGSRYPHELSGGQQQRVALARALAPAPEILLLDEPFSNLDVNTRERLAGEVRDIIKATNHTAIIVTHNQDEAFAMADQIGVMREGRLEQWSSPAVLRAEPASHYVQRFLSGELDQALARVD
ncbi:ABC transporter ATP-binding protein [Pseudomonas sp. GD03944]|uniref:ABC transporter ATP-binding protein n=1 Tax=Pseudomonas sp. GD03944 TaxID=2975409 RepID=UPI0032651D6A